MKTCNNCQNILDDSANFCNLCGNSDFTPIPVEPERPEPEVPEQAAVADGAAVPAANIFDTPPAADAYEVPSAAPTYDVPPAENVYTAPPAAAYYADGGIPVTPKVRKKPSKGLIIGLCGAGVALIAAIVVILILTNPVRRFMNSIKDGDAVTAAQIYYSSIYGNSGRTEKAEGKLDTYVDEQLSLYMNGEISYDDLSTSLWTIESAGTATDNVYDAIQQAAYIYDCRETFASAEAAFAAGDYTSAVLFYSRVAGADFESGEEAAARLAEATDCYRNEVLESVNQQILDNAYTSAQALLSDALEILPNDAALTDAYEQCIQAESDYTIQCILEEAQIYLDNDDFSGAIAFLDEQIALYPDEVQLQDGRTDCLTQFEEYVVSESYRLAAGGDFTKAAALAASGLEYFTSDKVTQLQKIYLSHIPILLGEMEIFANNTKSSTDSSYTNKTDLYLEDKSGAAYSHSFSVGCGSVTYFVNYSYQTFSGTVAFPSSLEPDDTRKSATLTIYGDGQEIAVFRGVTAATAAEEFSLDISTYEQLVLLWEVEGTDEAADWGDFATIFDGELIPIPQELPENIG